VRVLVQRVVHRGACPVTTRDSLELESATD
jgi:hypothetical protein